MDNNVFSFNLNSTGPPLTGSPSHIEKDHSLRYPNGIIGVRARDAYMTGEAVSYSANTPRSRSETTRIHSVAFALTNFIRHHGEWKYQFVMQSARNVRCARGGRVSGQCRDHWAEMWLGARLSSIMQMRAVPFLVRKQTAVTAYLKSEQLLLFVFARRSVCHYSMAEENHAAQRQTAVTAHL